MGRELAPKESGVKRLIGGQVARVYICCGCPGGVLLFRTLAGAVPSALGVLASGFGMGPGVAPPL